MKSIFSISFILVLSSTLLLAQKNQAETQSKAAKSEKELKIEESIAKIKKEIQNIKVNIDSTNLSKVAEILEKSADDIEDEIENIVDEVEEKVESLSDSPVITIDPSKSKDEKKEEKDIKLKRFHKGKRTKLQLDYSGGITGINNIAAPISATDISPELKPWNSSFMEIGLKFKTKIGGNKSRFSVNYGLGYRWNNMDFSNGVKLMIKDNIPSFVKTADNVKSSVLNIGYLCIPVDVDCKIGRKGRIGAGAYAGYRVHSVQKIKYNEGSEEVHETRLSNYGLNNVVYGLNAKVGVDNLVLFGNYNLSNVFKSSNQVNWPNYDMNLYSFGLNVGF